MKPPVNKVLFKKVVNEFNLILIKVNNIFCHKTVDAGGRYFLDTIKQLMRKSMTYQEKTHTNRFTNSKHQLLMNTLCFILYCLS